MANRRIVFHYEANNVTNPRVLLTTALNFGMNKVLLVNTSGQNMQGNESLEFHPELDVAMNAKDENGKRYKDYTLVYFKPPESIPGNEKYKGYSKESFDFTFLKDFIHPEGDVLYIIGPDQYTLPIDMMHLSGDNELVALEITRNSLWSIVAGGIVSRDAYLQDQYGKFVE
jgi:hypothetical protein